MRSAGSLLYAGRPPCRNPIPRPPHSTATAATATQSLSEHASKTLLADYAVPIARELLVDSPDAAGTAARKLGFPVVVKLCGDAIAHKTERDLVRLNLGDEAARA